MTAPVREPAVKLERELEERTRELRRAIAHQTAISDVLGLMAASPTDVQPVLDAVAQCAAELCNAPYARILLIEGSMLKPAAAYEAGAIGGR